MQFDRRDIESALGRKGFVYEDTHHRYFYYEHAGKRTSIYTYTSRGSAYKTYNDPLLRSMRQQLHLDSVAQLADLVKCLMSRDDYAAHLRGKGLLPKAAGTSAPPGKAPKARKHRRRERR